MAAAAAKLELRTTVKAAAPTASMAVYTDEDAELDRELEAMAREQEPEAPIDRDQTVTVVAERVVKNLLSDVIEIGPAATINDLMDQCHQAKMHGCDSIYGTDTIIKHYCKALPTDVGYFVFHNIKVYMVGHFEQAMKRDNQTIQQKVFGMPKPDEVKKA